MIITVKKAELCTRISIEVGKIVKHYQTDGIFDLDFFLNNTKIGQKWYWVLRECGTNIFGDEETARDKIFTYWKNCYRLICVKRIRGGWTFETIAENCED